MANPNVFQQYLQAPRSVLDYQNEMDTADYRRAQLQGQQSQNALMSLGLQQKMRADQRTQEVQNAIQRAASISKTPEELITNLRGLGTPEAFAQADSLEKGLVARQQGTAAAGKDNAETAAKHWGLMGDAARVIMASPTPFTVQAALAHWANLTGKPTDQVAQMFAQAGDNPEAIKRLAAGFALQADKLLPKIETRNTGGTTDTLAIDPLTGKPTVTGSVRNTQSPDSVASVNATIRGQNLTDARAREQIASGKVPSGYRMKADGTLEFIPGGPADPSAAKKAAPTEFQGKSAAFGSRAQEADRILTELEGKYSPAGVNFKNAVGSVPLLGGISEISANSALSDESQRADQAQRDFVNAVLRQESGAVIGQSEFDNAKRQYFPQPGDSEAVIKQKAANRKRAVQGLVSNAGNAAVMPPGAPAAPSGGFKIIEVK